MDLLYVATHISEGCDSAVIKKLRGRDSMVKRKKKKLRATL